MIPGLLKTPNRSLGYSNVQTHKFLRFTEINFVSKNFLKALQQP